MPDKTIAVQPAIEFASLASVNERVMTFSQRLAAGRRMRRLAPRMQRLRKIRAKRMAPLERLHLRARKAAVSLLRIRSAGTKGRNYAKLSRGEKISIDRIIDKKRHLVGTLSRRLLPTVRKKEIARLKRVRSAKTESYNMFPNNRFDLKDPKFDYQVATDRLNQMKKKPVDERAKFFRGPDHKVKTAEMQRYVRNHSHNPNNIKEVTDVSKKPSIKDKLKDVEDNMKFERQKEKLLLKHEKHVVIGNSGNRQQSLHPASNKPVVYTQKDADTLVSQLNKGGESAHYHARPLKDAHKHIEAGQAAHHGLLLLLKAHGVDAKLAKKKLKKKKIYETVGDDKWGWTNHKRRENHPGNDREHGMPTFHMKTGSTEADAQERAYQIHADARHVNPSQLNVKKIGKITNKKGIKEMVIIEARRGRPSKDTDGDEEGGREHIIVQLRKAINLRGEKHVEFDDGNRVKVSPQHAHVALNQHKNQKTAVDKGAFARHIAKSHSHMLGAAKTFKPTVPLTGRQRLKRALHREDTQTDFDWRAMININDKADLSGIDAKILWEVYDAACEEFLTADTDLDEQQFAFDKINTLLAGLDEEDLNELSKKTLASYTRKSATDMSRHNAEFHISRDGKDLQRSLKRSWGIDSALSRLRGDDVGRPSKKQRIKAHHKQLSDKRPINSRNEALEWGTDESRVAYSNDTPGQHAEVQLGVDIVPKPPIDLALGIVNRVRKALVNGQTALDIAKGSTLTVDEVERIKEDN